MIDKSIVLNGVQSFLNYSNHQFQKLINDNKDPEGWTAYENAMQDGFSDDDYEKHFHGIDHKIDYDYVKDGILKERELNEFRAQYPDIDTFTSATSFILDAMALPAVTKVIKAPVNLVSSLITNEKALKVFNFCTALTDQIPNRTLQHVAKGAFAGFGIGYLDYKTHYEMEPDVAFQLAGAGAILGTASGVIAKAPQFFKNVMKRVQTEDSEKTFSELVKREWKSPKPGKWDASVDEDDNTIEVAKKTFQILDRLPFIETPASIIQRSPSKSLNLLLGELCDRYTPLSETIQGDKLLSAEVKAKILMKDVNIEFGKLYKYFSNKRNTDVFEKLQNVTGAKPAEIIDRIIQTKTIPFSEQLEIEFPSLYSMFKRVINTMEKTENRLLQEGYEAGMEEIVSRPVLTPEAVRELKTISGYRVPSFDDYVDLEKRGLIKPELHYIGKRNWDASKVFKDDLNKDELLDYVTFSEGLIRYLDHPERGKHSPINSLSEAVQKFNQFMGSDNARKLAASKLQTMIDPTKKFFGDINEVNQRTILLSNQVTSKWHRFSTASSYFRYLKRMSNQVVLTQALNKVAKECGVAENVTIKSIDQFLKVITRPELEKHFNVTTDAITQKVSGVSDNVQNYIKHAPKIQKLFESAKLLCSAFDGSYPSANGTGTATKVLFGLRRWMYGSLLGMSPISSLPDGANLIKTFGFKSYVKNVFNKDFQVMVDGSLKRFSKEEMQEILDVCPYGLENSLYKYLLRDGDAQFDLLEPVFYGNGSKLLEKFISGGNKWAQITNKWSGMQLMDDLHIAVAQRSVLQFLLKHPEVTGNTKKEILHMMETKNFSDNVSAFMYNQIASLTDKPRLHHKPYTGFSPIGVLLNTFLSWARAHTYDFIKPLFSSGSPYSHKAQALLWVAAMSGFSYYLRSLANGRTFDLSSDEDQKIFLDGWMKYGLSELLGVYSLINSVAIDPISKVLSSASRRGSTSGYNNNQTTILNTVTGRNFAVLSWSDRLLTSVIRSMADASNLVDVFNSSQNWWWSKMIINNASSFLDAK